MDKSTLKRLGQLWRIQEEVYSKVVDEPNKSEWNDKYKLITYIKSRLEEQKRGFLKTKVKYSPMADVLIENWEKLSYDELFAKILNIIFNETR